MKSFILELHQHIRKIGKKYAEMWVATRATHLRPNVSGMAWVATYRNRPPYSVGRGMDWGELGRYTYSVGRRVAPNSPLKLADTVCC